MPRLALLGWSLAALAAGACAGETDFAPTTGDRAAELTLDGVTLRATWPAAGDHLVAPPLEAPDGVTRAGFLLVLTEPDAPVPALWARGVDEAGQAGPWVRAEITWREGDQVVARADLPGGAAAAQARVARAGAAWVRELTWSAVVPVPSAEDEPEPEVAGAREALSAELTALGVRSRGSWGARSTSCSANASKDRMAIHHTVTPSSGDIPARLRGIQAYHMDTNGWCDIGYHFLVDRDGNLWEGRRLGDLGAHVGGNNTGNIGISFIGCFHSSACSDWTPFQPPEAMIASAGRLVGTLAGMYGIAVSSETVKGHRDHPGQSTSCPGDYLHARLGDIRAGSGAAAAGPAFAAAYVHQSFPLARDPFEVPAGTEVAGTLELRNTGAETWRPGEVFLGTTEPRDAASALAASDWLSPNRPATVDREVAPGETGVFAFSVRAPAALGDHAQYFNLVREGLAWFSDPGQGGPVDGQLQIKVTSTPAAEPPPPTDPDAGAPEPGSDAGADGEGADAGADAGGSPGPGLRADLRPRGGCAVAGAWSRGSPSDLVAALGLALAAGAHRRRRRLR